MESDFPLSNQVGYQVPFFNEEHRRKTVHQIIFNALSKEKHIVFVGDEDKIKHVFPELWELTAGINEDWIDSFQELDHITKSILDCAKRLQKPIFGNLSLLELAEIAEASNQKKTHEFLSSTIEDKQFEFTKKEFWNLRGKLEKAASIFSEDIDYLDRNSIVDDSVFVDNEEDTRQIVRKYIARFLTYTEELLADFAGFFVRFEKEQGIEYSRILDQVEKSILSLENKWEYYKIDINSKTLDRLQLQLKSLDVHSSLTKKDLKKGQGFQVLKKALQLGRKQKSSYIKAKVKAINIKSYSSKELESLDDRLETIVKEINGSAFLKDRLELNAISTWIRFKNLQGIYKKLSTCRELMQQDHRFFEWKSCLNDSGSKMKTVLTQLRMFPKEDWMLLYESWYLNKVVSRSNYENHALVFDNLQRFDETYDAMSSDFSAVVGVIQRHHNATLKAKNKAFTFEIIPIEKLQADLQVGEESHMIVLDLDNHLSNDQLQFCGKLFNENSNISYLSGLPNIKWTSDLKINRNQIAESFAMTDIEVKLDYAKALAFPLVNQAGHIKFLFTRKKNIIVNAFTFKTEKILDSLKDSSLKQMQLGEQVHRSITEFFLNECEAGYYIYDQSAYDFQSTSEVQEHIEWIRAIQQAGYYTIYIDNTRIDELGYIESLIPQQIIHESQS